MPFLVWVCQYSMISSSYNSLVSGACREHLSYEIVHGSGWPLVQIIVLQNNKRMWDSLQVHKHDAPLLLLPTCILKVEKRESTQDMFGRQTKPKRWAQITHYKCTHKSKRDAQCTKSGKSCQKKKLTQTTGHLIEFYLQDGWHMTLNNFFGATSPSHHTAIVGHLSSFINTFNSRPQNAEITIGCSQ